MSFWDDLTGKTASDASKAAAADTYGKQQGAIGKLLGYGDDYKGGMDALSTKYQPFVDTGLQANDAYSKLLANPSSVSSLPGYQFDLSQGVNAVDHSAGARGMDQSGRTLKDLTRFGTGLADKTYGDQLTRLLGGTQLGMNATGAQVGVQGQGLQGQLSTRGTAYGGDMTSAGTIGQGDIAAANARGAGSQNILNTGLKLGGMALGAFSPMGALGSGDALTSLLGGRGSGYSVTGFDGAGNPNYGRA